MTARRAAERAADGGLVLALAAAPWSISLLYAGLAVSLLGAAVERRAYPPGRRLPLLLPTAAFVAASLLAAATAFDPLRAWSESRNLLWLALPWYVWSRRSSLPASLPWLAASGVAAALLGLGQVAARGIEFRACGTATSYMTYSGVMLTWTLAAASVAVATRSGRTRLAALAVVLPCAAALVYSQTRGAWLGLAAGLALLTLRRPRLLLLLPVAGAALLLPGADALERRARSILDDKDPAIVERRYMWATGLRIWRDHPWTGVGPENVEAVYPRYRDPRDPRVGRLYHLHSNPVQLAAERGLLGLGAWLAWWIGWFALLARRLRETDASPDGGASAWAAAAAAAGFLVLGMFEYTFGDTEVLAPVLALTAFGFPSADLGERGSPAAEQPRTGRAQEQAGDQAPGSRQGVETRPE